MESEGRRKPKMSTIIWVAVVLALVAVGLLYFSSVKSKSDAAGAILISAPKETTAKTLAAEHNCKRFSPRLRNSDGIYYSDAHCWIGEQRYGVAVLDDAGSFEIWLQAEKNLGVVPVWQGETWAIYKAG